MVEVTTGANKRDSPNRDAGLEASARQGIDQGNKLGRKEPHDNQPTIYGLAHQCLKAFERLRFTLEQPDPLYSELIPLPAVDDENGRFRGWASNIGALKTDRSSLQFRIRDVTFLFDNVTTLLESLQISLLEVTKIITGIKVPYEAISEDKNDYDSESSYESDEPSESQDRLPSTPLPEVQQHYLAIVDAIDRLYKLSTIIRSPQLRNRSTKAEAFIERDSESRDVSAGFERYAITRALYQMCTWKNITDQANLTDDEKALATRLGKANSRRRRQFMYDQRHYRKLANFEHDIDKEVGRNTSAPEVSEAIQDGGQEFSKAFKMPTNPYDALSSIEAPTLLSETTATKYIALPKQPSDSRSATSDSTAYSGYQMSDISIPPAPEDKFNKEFQCPYCYMILPAKARRADVWGKHVMKDLQPYVCIYDPCPTQDILYDSEAAWLKHEQWEHARQWCCDSSDHPLVMFPAADEFKNHMREVHSETFQEHQLQGLADASKRPSFAAFEFCPLCGITSEKLGNPQASGEASIPDAQALAAQATIRTKDERFVTTKALEDLQKHIAHHLRLSAMIALPGRDDLDEAKSVSNAGSQKAKSDTFDIFDTPIDGLEPCPFVEEFEESADLTSSDNELLWKTVFSEVLGDRYGEDLGLEEALVFAWPRGGLQQVSSKISDDLDQLPEPQDDRERREENRAILDWLSPIDYSLQQNDFIAKRQEGTGLWLLNSKEFQGWLNQSAQTLLCPGIAGVGKTIITSIVVDYLHKKFHSDTSIGITYVYCSFIRRQEQTPENLLTSLLKQLVQQQLSMPENVKSLYESHKSTRTRPSFEEISKVLHSVMADYSKVFIIIDALNECQDSDGSRRMFLSEILNLQAKADVNLFATSRPHLEIIRKIEGSVLLEIRARDGDMERYLDGKMSQLRSFVSGNLTLQKDIKAKITQAANGVFLFAQIYIDSLRDKTTPNQIREAMERLPKSLFDIYREAMERIEGQDKDLSNLAKQVLSWIIYAKRPLTSLEIRHALAVEIGESNLDEEDIPDIEDIVSVCAGLVTVDEHSDIIRLVHYTTQQYFELSQISWFLSVQKDIAMTCITYLSFDAFKTGFCGTDEEFEARLQQNPLYDYAARNWGHHARAASAEMEQSVMDFLENKAMVSGSSQAMVAFRSHSGYSQNVPRQMTGVHIAAYFGLERAIMALLKNGHDLDSLDSRGWTPLLYAARNGREAVVKLLLEMGAELESKGNDGKTPLLCAACYGREAVVKLLLKMGAELESKDNSGGTPLLCAAYYGHEAVVKLLLEMGAELESKDNYGGTPLLCAAINGHEAVVKLLLEMGAELESKDNGGRTPLLCAAHYGRKAVVKLLLEMGVELESKDKDGRTPLLYAAYYGREAVVKLLLEMGAEPEFKDEYSWTPLLWAADSGHEAVVKLLLEMGAELESKHNDGRTPLLCAAGNGHEAVVKLLLEMGAELESKDNYGRTPLLCAAGYGHEAVVKLLLEMGVELESKDNYGGTPLLCAAYNGHEAVVKLLLEVGAELESKDDDGRTPLLWAADNGHEAVVKLLLGMGAELEYKDNDSRTPLLCAARNGHEAVVKLLLEMGAELESKDNYGRTPLLCAARNGHEAVVKLLLEIGAELESKDRDGKTPLLWAADNGHEAVVKLLEKGADNSKIV